jgi:hypothetical protein
MSKHGYEVKNRGQGGWFSGVCSGNRYAPIERERAQADMIIASVREECASLRQRAADIRAGVIKPKEAKKDGVSKRVEVNGRYEWVYDMVPFDQAPRYYQDEAVKSEAFRAERRAEMGESFARDLEKIVNEYHGKPLLEVAADAGPAPILAGERRLGGGGERVLIAKYVDRGMVHWKDERGFGSKMHSRSWRLLPMAPAAENAEA